MASAAVGAITICMPAMSSPLIGERSSETHAATVTASSPAYTASNARSRITRLGSERGGCPGVILLMEVVGAVERLDEIAVVGRLVARGIRRAHAEWQHLDTRLHVGAVEERHRIASS